MRARGPAVTLALGIALACPTASGQEMPAAPTAPNGAETGSTCPSADEVWAILFTLLPAEARDLNLRTAFPPLFELRDDGPSYEVRAEGTSRAFDDPTRDCPRRARLAAVFVAVAIEPRVAAALPAQAAPPAPPPVERRLDLAISGTLWSAPSQNATPAAGATVHAAYGFGVWGLATGVTWQAPWTQVLGSTAVREQRLAVIAAARRQWRFRAGVPFLEAGLAAVGTRFETPDLASAQPATTLEGAISGLGGVRWGTRRVAPWFAVGVRLVPLPARVTDIPAGELGRAPRFWLTADVGLSVML